MSTIVTYKGSTLTTAENQTRVLRTAGKYMEDDVTIVDSGGTYEDGDNMSYGSLPSDLTGTTWYFNDTIDFSHAIDGTYYLNYTCNNINLTGLIISVGLLGLFLDVDMATAVGGPRYYWTNSWYGSNVRTITITGGTDATNANLIAFIMANAVRQ